MRIAIDPIDLGKFNKKIDDLAKQTNLALSKSINKAGDDLVALLISDLSMKTRLDTEQVRRNVSVKRASKGNLAYSITIKNKILDEPETIEGKREGLPKSKRPGKLEDDDAVIIVHADDDLVCSDCEELAAEGAMPFSVAKEHVPKHPNCRCVIMPYRPRTPRGKRLPVTMTTLTGTDPVKRSGREDVSVTLRQMAQRIMDQTIRNVRLELK